MAIDNDGVNIVITGDSSKAVQEIRKVEASVNGLLSLEVGKSLDATFGTFFKTITSTLQSVARAVSGVMKSALSIGGGFEAQMTSVKIISGATAEELDKLTAKAREMGATLPITAKDAAQAMELLAQRGTQAKDILVTVADVSALAISQNVDMASAADLLGSTMTNFGIAVQDAAKVTDIFNNACNQSALSMSKIINAMKYVGPAAGAVGMDLTEAVSALEVLTNAGLTGEMAGAGLALVLNKLASASHVLGVDTKNLDGSMRSLKDIFSELQKKGFSLADATALFGMRGNKAALALAKYSASLEQNQANLQKWGATQSAVTEKMKTWTNIWNSFQSATEEFHIEVFEQIKEQAKDAVGSFAELTRIFSKWVGDTKIAGQALNAFLNGLGFNIPSNESFQKLLNSFNVQSFLDSVQSFGSALKGIADNIVWAFDMIKTPLAFLIQHLGAFASISFWGWIIGKGLQVPAAIMAIVAAFKQFYSAVAALNIIKWVTLTGYIKSFFSVISSPIEITAFLSASKWAALINPITAIAVLCSTLGYNIGAVRAEVEKASQVLDDTINRIQSEIRDADFDLKLHLDFNVKTGFEKIPEAYFKASDELRASFDQINKAAQSAFKNQFSEALDFVIQKFPALAEEAKKAGINLNKIGNETYSSVAKALSGNEDAYMALPDIFKKVTEHINQMNLALGKGNKSLIYTIAKFDNLQRETERMKPQNKVNTFYEDITANLRNVLANLPKLFDEANKFLNGSDIKLAVNVSLDQAKSQLDAFVKDTTDKFAIPEDIVKQSTINRLKELANAGNKTAQILLHAWGNLDSSLEDFIDNAKEAITYLGASPQQFLPALNSMLNGIQKFDPVTGKLTEKFKKAHDALKEWANVTFDNLSNRIQKLRKAVEGGFIDKSVLEYEIKRSLPQLKLQIISELEPMRTQFNSQNAYEATIASDLVNKVIDMFGEAGQEFVQTIYQGMSGAEIGRAILRDNQRDLSGSNGATAYINGVEQNIANVANSMANTAGIFNSGFQLVNNSLNNNSAALTRAGDSMLSFINSIHTPNSNNVSSPFDYSAQFSNVIQHFNSLQSATVDNTNAVRSVEEAVQKLDNPLASILNLHQNYSKSIDEIVHAVLALHSAVSNLSAGHTFNIEVLQNGFNVQNNSDAEALARHTVNAIRSGLGNGGL